MSTQPIAPADDGWERLRGRKLPHLDYPLLVDDPTEAQARLAEVAAGARQVMLRHDPGSPEWTAAQQDVEAAKVALDACYVVIGLTALPPPAYEDLIDEHPPTAEQAAADEVWNVDTLRPALLAACATPARSPTEWAAFLVEHMSKGERQGLWVTCLAVNESARPVDGVVLPKGWTPTRS